MKLVDRYLRWGEFVSDLSWFAAVGVRKVVASIRGRPDEPESGPGWWLRDHHLWSDDERGRPWNRVARYHPLLREGNPVVSLKEDMAEWYDTCDYPPSHPCYSKQNAKRLGFFKDGTNGIPIHEFIGLRAKMHSIRLGDGSTKMTAMGIDRGFVKRNIKHEQYRACLEEYARTTAQFKTIRSLRQNHFLWTFR